MQQRTHNKTWSSLEWENIARYLAILQILAFQYKTAKKPRIFQVLLQKEF